VALGIVGQQKWGRIFFDTFKKISLGKKAGSNPSFCVDTAFISRYNGTNSDHTLLDKANYRNYPQK